MKGREIHVLRAPSPFFYFTIGPSQSLTEDEICRAKSDEPLPYLQSCIQNSVQYMNSLILSHQLMV